MVNLVVRGAFPWAVHIVSRIFGARAVAQKVQLVQSKNMQISCSTFFV